MSGSMPTSLPWEDDHCILVDGVWGMIMESRWLTGRCHGTVVREGDVTFDPVIKTSGGNHSSLVLTRLRTVRIQSETEGKLKDEGWRTCGQRSRLGATVGLKTRHVGWCGKVEDEIAELTVIEYVITAPGVGHWPSSRLQWDLGLRVAMMRWALPERILAFGLDICEV